MSSARELQKNSAEKIPQKKFCARVAHFLPQKNAPHSSGDIFLPDIEKVN